jgi:hypothetical protein
LALSWIREDRDLRREKEKEKGRIRGPRLEVSFACFFTTKMGLTQTMPASIIPSHIAYAGGLAILASGGNPKSPDPGCVFTLRNTKQALIGL